MLSDVKLLIGREKWRWPREELKGELHISSNKKRTPMHEPKQRKRELKLLKSDLKRIKKHLSSKQETMKQDSRKKRKLTKPC